MKIYERLKNEREKLGLKLTEVAKKMGFKNYQILSNIEAGKRELKAWELFKLAQIYGCDINYFLKPEAEKAEKVRILWRALTSAEEKAATENKLLTFCRNYQRLIELTGEQNNTSNLLPANFKKNNFTHNSFSYIEEQAKKIADFLQLGSRPACSLPAILEEKLGIKILYLDLNSTGSAASTKNNYFGEAILINATDAPWRRHFDLAHELFHLLTWDLFSEEEVYKKDGKSEVEIWAECFASAILLPEHEVKNEFEKRLVRNHIDLLSLVEIAREFSVSIEALLWRLVNLNLLTRTKVTKALETGEIKDIDKKVRSFAWQQEKPSLSPRYVGLAVRAFQLGKISKMKLAEYLDVPFGEVTTALRRYGYDENEDYSLAFTTSGRRRNN